MKIPVIKKPFIFAGIVLAIITIPVTLLLLANKSKSSPNTIKPKENTTTKPRFPNTTLILENYLKYAKINLDAINKQRDNKNRYHGYLIGLADGTKQPPAIDNRAFLGITLGRYQYYLATGNQEELTAINKDLEMYLDPILDPVLQNNLWNCKIMYRLSQDSTLDQTTKDLAKKICDRGIYYTEEAKDNPGFLSNVSDKLASETDVNNIFNINPNMIANNELKVQQNRMIEYSGFASDFVSKYLWDKKENDLNTAKSWFNTALDKYTLVKNADFVHGQCVLGIASLDLYGVTKENKYLDFAKKLYDKSQLDICLSNAVCKDNLFDKTTCGYFVQDLYNLIQDNKYLKTKAMLINSIINSHFDYQGFTGKIEGDGLFYQKLIYKDLKKDIIKDIRDNGLVVGLLSQPENKGNL